MRERLTSISVRASRIAGEVSLVDRKKVRKMKENLQTAIQQAIEEAQIGALSNLAKISFDKNGKYVPTNRIQEEVRLPSRGGKPVKIAMFAGGEMAAKAKAGGLDGELIHQHEDLGETNRRQEKSLSSMISSYLRYHIWVRWEDSLEEF